MNIRWRSGHMIALTRYRELSNVHQLCCRFVCEQCMADGNMAFGWHDKGRQLRYRVSLFTELEKTPIDQLGIVVNDCSREEPKLPTFHDGVEVMCLSEIWEEFPGRDVPDLQNIFNEERAKLGGWPYWWHEPEYPEDELGNPMQFVAQLHLEDCPTGPSMRKCLLCTFPLKTNLKPNS